ncbi:MAG: glycosyltransferase family 4 protein [Anaerolineae bacterium]
MKPAERTMMFLRSSAECAGIERRLVYIAQALAEAGFPPLLGLLYRRRPGRPDEHPAVRFALGQGVPAVQIPDPAPWSPRAGGSLQALFRQRRPLAVHSNDYRSDMLAWAARGNKLDISLISTCHGHTGAAAKVRLYEFLDRLLLPRFDCVVGVSEHQCRLLRRWGVPAERVRYLPNFIEPGWEAGDWETWRVEMRRQMGADEGQPLLGYFGRDSREKGLDVLLKAFPRIRRERPDARLLVVGPAGRPPAGDGIFWAGFQPDIRPWLSACDLVVVPSRREAFGLAALEALAAGRPVIASCVGGLPEIVRDGISGRLVPPGDAAVLAEAVLEALADPERIREWGEAGRREVWSLYRAEVVLPQWVELYRAMQIWDATFCW